MSGVAYTILYFSIAAAIAFFSWISYRQGFQDGYTTGRLEESLRRFRTTTRSKKGR